MGSAESSDAGANGSGGDSPSAQVAAAVEAAAAAAAAAAANRKAEVEKMSIKELKTWLDDRRIDRSRCMEKRDLVRLVLTPEDVQTSRAARPQPKAPPRKKKATATGPGRFEFCPCFDWIMPSTAPDWYKSKLGGAHSLDVHGHPAPEGSIFLLGHISLAVPDLDMGRSFYNIGVGCGISDRSYGGELFMNAGASQIRLRFAEPGKGPDRWPGVIRLWCDDIQTTYDMMTAVEGGMKTAMVKEYGDGINGGEFSMFMHDPWAQNFLLVTEAPRDEADFADRVRKIGCEATSFKENIIAISDAMIKTRSKDDAQAMAKFYKHFFEAPISEDQSGCMVHFSPGKELHQTITFKEDEVCPPYTDLGSLCFYIRAKDKFRTSFAKCSKAGIVESPDSWEEAEKEKEFIVKAIVDPDGGRQLIPMRNIVRLAEHRDCIIFV